MENLEYIDAYFKGEVSPDEKNRFEERILKDPVFAQDVAFYLGSLGAVRQELKEEKKARFKKFYQKRSSGQDRKPVMRLWPYIAAAALIAGIIFGYFIILKPDTPKDLANKYIRENLQSLGVSMYNKENRMDSGKRLYNEGKFPEALQQFEKILHSDSSDFEAKKFAGIVSLRIKDYDKALEYFSQLRSYTALQANPAVLYMALTYMERNQSGDSQRAKQLLEQVDHYNLEGKEVAKEWLRFF